MSELINIVPTIKDIRPFHFVSNRPWPSILANFLLEGLLGFTELIFGEYLSNSTWLCVYITIFLISKLGWLRDVRRERNSGQHAKNTTLTIKSRVVLFIISEVCLFFGFFWSFFWTAYEYKLITGIQWPPTGIRPFNPYHVPLLNRIILLTSGVTVTWSHKYIYVNNHKQAALGIILTIILGILFTYFQFYEYKNRSFSMSDSVYGSLFFIITGFHGAHVILGTIFLISRIIRLLLGQINSKHHNNKEFAIWYWHFVDIVWLILYLWVYWWHY